MSSKGGAPPVRPPRRRAGRPPLVHSINNLTDPPMKASPATGFTAGLIGGLAVVAAIALIVFLGVIPKAPYAAAWQAMFGGGWLGASILGGLLFVVGGGIWGALFALLLPDPTVLKGILFGLLPTLWQGAFVVPVIMGEPAFHGFALLPNALGIVANCLIWGSIAGWYCARHLTARSGRATGTAQPTL